MIPECEGAGSPHCKCGATGCPTVCDMGKGYSYTIPKPEVIIPNNRHERRKRAAIDRKRLKEVSKLLRESNIKMDKIGWKNG